LFALVALGSGLLLLAPQGAFQTAAASDDLDGKLAAELKKAGFTGKIESTLTARLGRSIDPKLADLGRLLWFDKLHSLHRDNTCGGCHSPTNGFGDTQSIAIGVQNNNLVGPGRTGPRNQRRSPLVVNTPFLSALMWNGRFSAPSGDPFDNSKGFLFPPPESDTRFLPGDPVIKHLLQAQGELPPTELVEVAGFTGACTQDDLKTLFCQFDDGLGETIPLPDSSGSRNEPIRQQILVTLNATRAYRDLFGGVFPSVKSGGKIDFNMFGLAIAEFEFTLVFADAPIDRFARGDASAMTAAEKRGALLFLGKAGCVGCHAVAGQSNEMFTDFKNRVVGVPQIAPEFGVGKGNLVFDGPGSDEDFGLQQISGNSDDRYKFRTAPLRNLAVAPALFHNGAFTTFEDALMFHLNAREMAPLYDPIEAGVAPDLTKRLGPIQPVLDRLDSKLKSAVKLDESEFADLVAFVRDGLLDPRAKSDNLCKLVPKKVPSGLPVMVFEKCQK
jgi:cytochrome c peroxidase